MMNKFLIACLASTAVMGSAANAAPTVFVPQVVNLSATVDAQSRSVVSFLAGSYTIALVNNMVGMAGYNSAATFTAWAPAVPSAGNWADFYQYVIGGKATYVNPFTTGAPRYADPLTAYNAYAAFAPLTLNFSQATEVTFQIADQGSLGDDSGGVSLSISPSAVPESSTWAMMIAGLGMVGYALRSRKSAIAKLA